MIIKATDFLDKTVREITPKELISMIETASLDAVDLYVPTDGIEMTRCNISWHISIVSGKRKPDWYTVDTVLAVVKRFIERYSDVGKIEVSENVTLVM